MGNRKYFLSEGDVFYSLDGGKPCAVLDAKHTNFVKIKWQDEFGHEMIVQAAHLRTGQIKNPYNPAVHGVGYFGVGSFKASKEGRNTKEYKIWWHMLERCYLPSSKSYGDYGARGVSVCTEWHNFQTFAAWLVSQKGWARKDYELDKDVLGDGREYSPAKCAYVPRAINSAIRSDYSVKIANVYKTHNGLGWWVQASRFGKQYRVGTFKSQGEAEAVSIATKREYIAELAKLYASEIDADVYAAMLEWEPLKG